MVGPSRSGRGPPRTYRGPSRSRSNPPRCPSRYPPRCSGGGRPRLGTDLGRAANNLLPLDWPGRYDGLVTPGSRGGWPLIPAAPFVNCRLRRVSRQPAPCGVPFEERRTSMVGGGPTGLDRVRYGRTPVARLRDDSRVAGFNAARFVRRSSFEEPAGRCLGLVEAAFQAGKMPRPDAVVKYRVQTSFPGAAQRRVPERLLLPTQVRNVGTRRDPPPCKGRPWTPLPGSHSSREPNLISP